MYSGQALKLVIWFIKCARTSKTLWLVSRRAWKEHTVCPTPMMSMFSRPQWWEGREASSPRTFAIFRRTSCLLVSKSSMPKISRLKPSRFGPTSVLLQCWRCPNGRGTSMPLNPSLVFWTHWTRSTGWMQRRPSYARSSDRPPPQDRRPRSGKSIELAARRFPYRAGVTGPVK